MTDETEVSLKPFRRRVYEHGQSFPLFDWGPARHLLQVSRKSGHNLV